MRTHLPASHETYRFPLVWYPGDKKNQTLEPPFFTDDRGAWKDKKTMGETMTCWDVSEPVETVGELMVGGTSWDEHLTILEQAKTPGGSSFRPGG